MTASIEAPVLNAVVIVTGTTDCDIPQELGKSRVGATSNCIAIGCRHAAEGNTTIHLSTIGEIDPGIKPVFVGRIPTPNHKIQVLSILWEVLLELPTPTDETEIRIWLNHHIEPDDVRIGIGGLIASAPNPPQE
jgi:hypothetical protein